MRSKKNNLLGAFHFAPLIMLALAVVMLGSSPAFAQSQSDSSNPLLGPWIVQVTLTDCATGSPLPGAPFRSLVTFNHAGTLTESTGGTGFLPGQRGIGHGAWTNLGGRTYLQRMLVLINFTTPPNLPGTPGFDPALPVGPGFFAGYQIVTHRFTLADADHASSVGTNEFFKTSGELYRSGCSTASAVRFK